ncbi:MAG TPA: hypothetical protein DGF30_00550 [Desulfomicrobium sp.]|nr:hypothetical protein [Desulfomicrobium sp.]
MTTFKWVLLAAFLVFLAFVFDTQLIVLRDEGTFNLYYDVPKEMEGKMFTSAYWTSDSFMCRQLSFGSGKFEPQGYGASARNVEEKPGIWVSHISTRIWHPFCQWELDLMTIGAHANAEKTSYHQLAYAFLYEPKDLKSDDEVKQGDPRTRNSTSNLVCDILENDFKRTYEGGQYVEKSSSYECKNPTKRGTNRISATPYVGFIHKESGKLKINYSNVKILYLRRNFFDKKINQENSYDKQINYLNGMIEKIDTTLGLEKYWSIYPESGQYKIRVGIPGNKPEFEISIQLNQEHLALLASDDVWELPDFIHQ